jgi:hypothetical protein
MAAEHIAYVPLRSLAARAALHEFGRHAAGYWKLRDAARSLLLG